jgi:hypothetical protein
LRDLADTLQDAAGYDFGAFGTFTGDGGIPGIFVQNIRDEVMVSSTVRFYTRWMDGEPCIIPARNTIVLIEDW